MKYGIINNITNKLAVIANVAKKIAFTTKIVAILK